MPHYSIGVDTSHNKGQLCLFKGDQLLKNIFWEKKGSHSERLNLYFHELLTEFKIHFSEIGQIFCSTGPGSFTGLRVGINFCKTLSYAHEIPVFAVSTLKALAYLCPHSDKNIISTIDAQKNALYVSIFNSRKEPLEENLMLPLDQLELYIKDSLYACGSGVQKYKDYLSSEVLNNFCFDDTFLTPDISKIILAHYKSSFLNPISWNQLQPLYIRLSSAEEKQQGTRPKS